MAKLVCLMVLAFAACMVSGLPQQDENKMPHRIARAADPQPQFYNNLRRDVIIPGPGHFESRNIHGYQGIGGYGRQNRAHLDEHCPYGHSGPCHYDVHVTDY